MYARNANADAHRSENDLMGGRKVHAPEHDDNRRLCICDQPEAFPDHETGGEDRGKVEDLEEDLWRSGSPHENAGCRRGRHT
jgi:hypothetical protein